jgi:hypothetical protein
MSCHVGHIGTYLITDVKQHSAQIVLGRVTTQMTGMRDAVRRCTRILWPEKASEKTPRRVIPPRCKRSTLIIALQGN